MGDTIQPTTVWSPRFFSTVNAASSGALCYQGCGHSPSLSHTHIVKVRVSAGRLPLGAPRVGPPSVSGVPLCPTRTRDRREGLPTDGSRTWPRQAACSLPSPTAPSASLRMNPGDKGDRELRRRDRRDCRRAAASSRGPTWGWAPPSACRWPPSPYPRRLPPAHVCALTS